MAKRKRGGEPREDEQIEYTVGSGNVYEDFEFSKPGEANAKADLALLICEIIKEKKSTQQQAAELIRIDQTKVSKIMRGQLSEFHLEQLTRFLTDIRA